MPGARVAVAALLGALLAANVCDADVGGEIGLGDAAWDRRAEGSHGLRASPAPIGEAIDAYTQAFRRDSESLEARWKLMRALYFQGEHVLEGRAEKLAVFERGQRLGEAGIDQLASGVGGRAALDRMEAAEIGRRFSGEPDAAGVYFWAGAHWGLWGRERGKIAAARQGVAGKVRDYAAIVVAIDDRFEKAGGHRVLGRLHAEAPRIPFVTGWVDRDRAIRELERSLELAPDSILSELYLIEALHGYAPRRRAEALDRLRALVGRPPHPDYVVEDRNALADARRLLADWTR